jgi:hypothetical protein
VPKVTIQFDLAADESKLLTTILGKGPKPLSIEDVCAAAALAALVAMWDGELQRTKNVVASGKYVDNVAKHLEVRHVLFARALPLTLYATLSWLILLPVVLQITAEVIAFWRQGGHMVFDPTKASLALLFLGLMLLVAYLWTTTKAIRGKERDIAALPES